MTIMGQPPNNPPFVTRKEMNEALAALARHFDEALALSEQRQHSAIAASEQRLRGEISSGIQQVIRVTTTQSNDLARQIQDLYIVVKTFIERG
jgi:hypothetical protein